MANRLFDFDQTPKAIAQFAAGSVQTAPNCSHRDGKDLADFLVTMTIEIFQDDHGAMFRAQLVERGLYETFAFRPFQGQCGICFG
jgi:hypothetical protein